MDIDARTLACWNDNAFDDATAGANSFRPQLRVMERGAANLFASGSIGSVSKNSASQSYAGAGFGRFSVAQIQQGYRMLIELYDDCLRMANYLYNLSQNYPANADGQCFIKKYPNYEADPDQAVYDLMSYRLIPVEDYQIDLSYLRLQPTLGANIPQTW